uniref:Uncharacterized protein n=1 Tax=viral metagenome TaxID=1070528 RepID=A0A6M3MH60_9ZZZZ
MDSYDWFTGGGQMSPAEVVALGLEGIEAGIAEIGIDEDQDASALAREIMAEAKRQLF